MFNKKRFVHLNDFDFSPQTFNFKDNKKIKLLNTYNKTYKKPCIKLSSYLTKGN